MPHAILIVDKPVGPTSHAVVASLRRTLGTRSVGHAGTLDPGASGVLVVAIGEATKLAAHLTSQPKRYVTTVTFGTSTSTYDADGDVVAHAPIPDNVRTALRSLSGGAPASCMIAGAIEIERRRSEQVPPAFSAIQMNGQRSYVRARRGETFDLPARVVSVTEIDVVGATEGSIDLSLVVSKGYYVRSLARDLGLALGVAAHVSSLRRTASGPFTIDEAIALSEPPDRISSAMIPVSAAAKRIMPTAELTGDGVNRASHGLLLDPSHFVEPPPSGLSAWLTASGDLVAIGRSCDEQIWKVARGFNCGAAPE
jgi:tRNA pseudouridine55 synthase